MATVAEISKEIGTPKKELISKGIRAYVRTELSKVEIELRSLYRKHNVSSIGDLEHLIEKGDVNESDVFDDLTKLDYLEWTREKLATLLAKTKAD
ncbi:MAG: hypothetical protein WBD09_04585 [Halobacteriota archaeon]